MNIGGVHFDPFDGQAGWFVANVSDDSGVVEKQARNFHETNAAPGYDAVCGLFDEIDESHRLYLIPTGNPGAIVEAFGVGSHGACYSMESPEQIRAEVETIHAHSPIAPFFADAAGFKFGFRVEITPELLALIDRTLTVGQEVMMEASYEAGGSGAPSEFVARERYVHLWWD